MTSDSARGNAVLIAAALLAGVFGSVHGFSVFLEPLEALFDAPRGRVSLTYSLTLVAITVSVLMGHRVFGLWGPARFLAGLCAMAVLGLAVAGVAPTLGLVWVGYSVIFGLANGLGYGFGLQIAAQANPGAEGRAMGIVTAAYALGAMVAPPGFAFALDWGGFGAAMMGLALVIVLAGGIAAAMMAAAGAVYTGAGLADPVAARGVRIAGFGWLWTGYGAGVAAGLMTIGHAAGMSRALLPGLAIWIAPAVVAVCNLAGSLVAGWISDRMRPMSLLIVLPLISALAAVALNLLGAVALIPALGLLGFAYGGVIAACPAAVAKRFGMGDGPRIYGRVFTAWGSAGLAAPFLAGWLFERTGGYEAALWMAVFLGLLASGASVIAARAA